MDDKDFLFTWKADKWPYEKLRALIDRFEAGDVVIEPWRCQARRQVRQGARAYVYKQGPSPKGIFAIAEIVGDATETEDVKEGEGRYSVPLRFTTLLDPTKRFLATEDQLLVLGADPNQLRTQGSGITFTASVARAIDDIAAEEHAAVVGKSATDSEEPAVAAGRRERLFEVYDRDQAHVRELKQKYQGRCQICDSVPFNGSFGNISEGHHIQWLCRGGSDTLDNMMLLCPNHHAAVHAADPSFDRNKLVFSFGSKMVPVRLDLHLKRK